MDVAGLNAVGGSSGRIQSPQADEQLPKSRAAPPTPSPEVLLLRLQDLRWYSRPRRTSLAKLVGVLTLEELRKKKMSSPP